MTSTSNCTDYQARRLNIRYRVKGEKGTRLLHTLNGTACAISRTLVFLFEHYQDADGGFTVPEVLRPFTGFERVEPVKKIAYYIIYIFRSARSAGNKQRLFFRT